MTLLYHTMQCKDPVSGKIGDFIHAGDMQPISPVFDSLYDLYAWMRENGFVTRYNVHLFGVEKI